ncbi:MAG: TlpA family protein disulfide reductase [Solirubrobacterales bacterium]
MSSEGEPGDDRSGEAPERKPPRGLASRETQAPARRYSLYVGLVFVALAIFAFVNTRLTRDSDSGILDSSPADQGAPLAPFSVPEALGSLEGDANVFQDDCQTSSNPCPAEDVRTPACEVEGDEVIRVCDLFARPLVISFWFTRGGDCLPSQDAFDDAAGRYGDEVNFLSVNVRDDREEVRQIIEDRGWQVPVGYDADGAVSSLYRVGGCPTLAFAYPGGILAGGAAGEAELEPEALDEQIDSLIADSRRRAVASR